MQPRDVRGLLRLRRAVPGDAASREGLRLHGRADRAPRHVVQRCGPPDSHRGGRPHRPDRRGGVGHSLRRHRGRGRHPDRGPPGSRPRRAVGRNDGRALSPRDRFGALHRRGDDRDRTLVQGQGDLVRARDPAPRRAPRVLGRGQVARPLQAALRGLAAAASSRGRARRRVVCLRGRLLGAGAPGRAGLRGVAARRDGQARLVRPREVRPRLLVGRRPLRRVLRDDLPVPDVREPLLHRGEGPVARGRREPEVDPPAPLDDRDAALRPPRRPDRKARVPDGGGLGAPRPSVLPAALHRRLADAPDGNARPRVRARPGGSVARRHVSRSRGPPRLGLRAHDVLPAGGLGRDELGPRLPQGRLARERRAAGRLDARHRDARRSRLRRVRLLVPALAEREGAHAHGLESVTPPAK